MEKVIESRRRAMVREKPGIVSFPAPVSNRLGDVVGLVEMVARARSNTHENIN